MMSTNQNNDTDARSSSAVAESYRALQWRNEAPESAGYYWMRMKGTTDARVVKVYHDSEYGMMFMRVGGHSARITTHPEMKWAGPIPEPEAESAG